MTYFKHGMTINGKSGKTHPVYNSWVSMKQRCYYIKDRSYKNYGGRGIKVCERWLESFQNFYEDMFPTWKEGLQLDRIDVNKDYTLDNCQWATSSQQNKNKRRKAIKQSSVDHVIYDARRDYWEVMYRFKSQEEAEQFAILVKPLKLKYN